MSSRDDSYSNHRIPETSTVETTRIRDHTAVVFVPHFGQTKREQELQHAYVKSHAARIGHSKRRAWKSAQPQEPAAGNPQELRKSDYNILMPHPQTLLSESTTDPFNNDECRRLSSLALKSLDHTYEIVWPGNFPTIRGSALRSLIQLWKRITVQSDLAFHTHVAQAASLCYLVSTDPEVKDNLMKVRINHQYISTKLVREAIGALSEPASDDLIESILRLGANGVNIIETPIVSKYPESPVMECLRHPKLYGRFEPAMPHFSILRHLVETRGGLDGLNPATSQPLQIYSLAMASMHGVRPVFEPLATYRYMSDNLRFDFDRQAKQFLSILGRGWLEMPESQSLFSRLAQRAALLTAALDQTMRAGQGHLTYAEVCVSAFMLKHDLCLTNPSSSFDDAGPEIGDELANICRLALHVFFEVVLFPAVGTYAAKPRLASELRTALTRFQKRKDIVQYFKLILWAVFMGTVAAEDDPKLRNWFLVRFNLMVIQEDLGWLALKQQLTEYLWWDFTFEERTRDIWRDACDRTTRGRR
ncbi:hypothetical protein LTS07_000661 [Exophiala sideris]|uniref:Tachykinin family protein n=1 Tax=Exophiala sideris TaxID=1016849 RepID=A0ABR0JRG6_9EURO|nr:hypothetical protein LTS07_000661 [Exophiala sideris]KAK5043409.1 hypothetical protein LTR13_001180 [Exophiala sideris]KAK5068542.1 hypothetical protein LTR69_000662 [Exophiala sideris]KAK5186140.1 hypothetical protein LTR44_001195 [Eurotiomycetes sp. CCFEE 6388]